VTEQCSAAIHHLITNAVFNLTSDIMMLCIPLPLLVTSQLPRTRKLILCVLFSLGTFVIMCALLNKYYSFAHPFSPMWEFWYIREASTAILVANMPICWPLLRRVFNLKAFNGNSSGAQLSTARSKSIPIATTYSSRGGNIARKGQSSVGGETEIGSRDRDERDMKGGGKGDVSWWERNDSGLSKTESEEYIIGNGKKDVPLQIWESRRVDVESGSFEGVARERDLRKDQVRIYDGVGRGGKGTGEFESTVRIEAGSARKISMGSLGRGDR
jgi:hypothetical protein